MSTARHFRLVSWTFMALSALLMVWDPLYASVLLCMSAVYNVGSSVLSALDRAAPEQDTP